ncbi:unnamed protein product [Prunus brigantina]
MKREYFEEKTERCCNKSPICFFGRSFYEMVGFVILSSRILCICYYVISLLTTLFGSLLRLYKEAICLCCFSFFANLFMFVAMIAFL